jgi:transcriptional regulator with XRE-family HTH domain
MTKTPDPSDKARRFRDHVGMTLQWLRLRRGLTQGQLAEHADVSLKYLGEIERGEANTTMEVIERLADALEWNPAEAIGAEPLTDGIRTMLISETEQVCERLESMVAWLRAIDPVKRGPSAGHEVGSRPRRHGRTEPRVSSRHRQTG